MCDIIVLMKSRFEIFRSYLTGERDHRISILNIMPTSDVGYPILEAEISTIDDIIHHFDIFVKRSLELDGVEN